jgi:hypothetical protein
MKNRNLRMVVLVVVALVVLAMASAAAAGPAEQGQATAAEVTSNITYQGQLTDVAGNPLTGSYGLKFELYDAAGGGTKLWEQTLNGVAVQEGVFTVQLQVNANDLDGQALWLAITVDGQLLSPRQELTPAPYALSLRPGARIQGDVPDPGVLVHNTTGVGVYGQSSHSYGVVGMTLDDAPYEAAGVHGHSVQPLTAGVMGSSDAGWGVYGKITNPDSTHSAIVGYNEGQGNAVAGVALHGSGVVGETQGDSEWEVAGVSGYSTNDRTFGVLGSSEWGIGVEGSIANEENGNPAVIGFNTGAGAGVWGYSQRSEGVVGETDADYAPAGRFTNNASSGPGVYASSGSTLGPDVMLGGLAGEIYSDRDVAGSSIGLVSRESVTVHMDKDNDGSGGFSVWNGDYEEIFSVEAGGDVYVNGSLHVTDWVITKGPACSGSLIADAGLHSIPVPDFCVDALCWITVLSDGAFGALGPGFSWPTVYMQYPSGQWWAGPNIAIAGFELGGGPGLQGDGVASMVGFGGDTAGGGVLRLWDDLGGENSTDQWTLEFEPKAGELSYALVFACPMGQPVADLAAGR